MIILCPGVHEQELTINFLKGLQIETAQSYDTSSQRNQSDPSPNHSDLLVVPAQQLPVYSGIHILEFLGEHCSIASPLVMICFSAGVVGGIGAAWGWQQSGGTIKAFMALDGWGVPLYGDFPIHRLSHDHFTHWSSKLLGAGSDSFYADPPVEHLELWRSPQTTQGWWEQQSQSRQTTAAAFLMLLLERYSEQPSKQL